MLFIYGALDLGGTETFFVRMAKERASKGLTTKILLFSPPQDSNELLLSEMKKYAKVYFVKDIYPIFTLFASKFPLLSYLNKKKLSELMENVTQIHAYYGMHLLLANQFNKIINKNLPITVGFYHYTTFTWGKWNIPHFEKINRRFIFDYLPRKSLMFFSNGNVDFHQKYLDLDLSEASTFKLGVIDKKDSFLDGSIQKVLKIVAVGRLVDFKTYNFFMLDVIKNLVDKKVPVSFDVFGDGPNKHKILQRIKELNIEKYVNLKGTLEYNIFNTTIKKYDIFIGSGTAIIQASALGIPSIIGIENMLESKTYGYFSGLYLYEYHLKGLDLPLLDVEQILLDYIALDKIERKKIQIAHLNSIDIFTNKNSSACIEELKKIDMPKEYFHYNILIYEFSRIVHRINIIFNKKNAFTQRHENLKKEL